GDAGDADAMIAQLRAQNAPITTVDSVGTAIATLTTVLALPSAQAQPRALGGEDSATSVFPDLQLSGRQAAPPAPHNEPADGAQSQSGGE
ncbi:MAG: copper transporter, partial [Actinomyces sp.]|nr:copper transporter [Actinomyces sp.]